ncbi:hypothetical protein [Pseudoalteromonas phage J2-1_QLiu-2017]|nr:hypothetical protein [Pseudoalteromonas phage J2-1_QLiu-2017]
MVVDVIDYVMGSGKSSFIIEQMNMWNLENEYDQFVYVSPSLSEVEDRIPNACPDIGFLYAEGEDKTGQVVSLMSEGASVSCTHNLLLGLEPEHINSMKEHKNILVVDEELELVRPYKVFSKATVDFLLNKGVLYVAEDATLNVNYEHEDYKDIVSSATNKKDALFELFRLCDLGYIVRVREGGYYVWDFPPQFVKNFDKVVFMSYMFEHSVANLWCMANDIEVEYWKIPELEKRQEEVFHSLSENINVVDTLSLNKIPEGINLSQAGWKLLTKDKLSLIKKPVDTFVNHTPDISGKDVVVTCPKAYWDNPKKTLQTKRTKTATWLASSTRGINDYADKKVMVYGIDKHPSPMTLHYFDYVMERDRDYNPENKVEIGLYKNKWKENYALSNMLQWLWRGCIRKNEQMYVIVLSPRMRKLLNKWVISKEEK